MSKGDAEISDLFMWLWDKTSTATEYTYFITHFDRARDLVSEMCGKNSNQQNPRFKEFLDKGMAHEQSRGMSLQSYLIQPIQRPPRYVLLLNDLFKHTPEDHPEHSKLKEAFDRTKRAVDELNEGKRASESKAKIALLQTSLTNMPEGFRLHTSLNSNLPRQFAMEGMVLVSVSNPDKAQKDKGSRYCYLFLFNDMLLFTKQQKAKYKWKRYLSLDEVAVVDLPQNETGQNSILLRCTSPANHTEFTISCKSDEKEGWLSGLRDALSKRK